MPKYIFTYHQPDGYVRGADPEAMAAWRDFFESIAGSFVDPGQPVFTRTAIGETAGGTVFNGYSVVDAATLEDAAVLAQGCPTLSNGGGVQIGELAELPPEHAAARIKAQLTRS